MLTVYLDMDGVLANFDKKIIELTGTQWNDLKSSADQ